jgi:hypothetical protein
MKSNYNFNLYYQNRSSENIGKITTAVYNLGNLKGIGSSTRIYNNCLNTTNDNVTECMSLFTAAAVPTPPKPLPPTTGGLFNTNTFYDTFDYNETGKKPIPDYIITALFSAVSRWEKFLKFHPDMVKLIRTLGYPNWTGLELSIFKYKNYNEQWVANSSPITFKKTTINPRFELLINTKKIGSYTNEQIAVILTHELGHALGFPCPVSLTDGTDLPQLLPNEFTYNAVETDPPAYNGTYFSKLLHIYNNVYNAYKYFPVPPEPWPGPGPDPRPPPTPVENYVIIGYAYNGKLTHWQKKTLKSKGYNNPNSDKFYYRGFKNEIMIPDADDVPLEIMYISKMTIAALMTQFSNINGKNYSNYVEINPGSSEVIGVKNPNIEVPIVFEGSY